jgi:hypothetical protein
MGMEHRTRRFSEKYGQVRHLVRSAREGPSPPVSENVIQCVWYDQLFSETNLRTDEGETISIMSPGWWNHGEGPDFRGAQIDFGGTQKNGDVEVHLDHAAWFQHGHHLDPRYDDVLLVVALEREVPSRPPVTSRGRRIPCLLLPHYLEEDISTLADRLLLEDYPYQVSTTAGQCSELVQLHGMENISNLLTLAGEWRILNKARLLRDRMEKAGAEQAVYEAFLTACGYSHFKHHFNAIARQLHYQRVRQLARQDPLVLEAAFFQLAGLLPEELPPASSALPHFGRLRAYRRDKLPGLRGLPLPWRRIGVRPINYPERRLAGAARFLAHTAEAGLVETLENTWRACSDGNLTPMQGRQAFEDLFPAPMGFWATHCTWTGKSMKEPCALLGPGRVRCIIGNVFVPAALAVARHERDREREEQVLEFFSHLPKEPDNHVLKIMLPRILGPDAAKHARLTFRTQQGLLQLHQDWCETNPSCNNCTVVQFLVPGRFP